jgi:benzoate/toluate 1,2-dioxygenase alpha subunit
MTGYHIADLIDDRPSDGVFRINRALFSEPAIFALELQHIFEGGWVFVGLATQAEHPHDFFTGFIGRVPILISRSGDGALNGFINACPHKGARIAQQLSGNAKLHVCPYHSWTFDSAGANRNVKWKSGGCYGAGFDQEDHNLARIPRFDEYRGFLFASLNPDVPSLDAHLGEARKLLDLVVDQSSEGVELVPGAVRFTYAANWKMQLENCSDQYHFTSTHPSYIRILETRAKEQKNEVVQSTLGGSDFWKEDAQGPTGGTFSFDNGHVLNWGLMAVTPALPLFERAEEIAERIGTARRNWMFNMRNLTIFPNLQIAENASSQLRVIRPIAHNMTEMQTWCIAPRGESAEARRVRIRQYEDFFNPTGMATPDDTVVYEECQAGMARQERPWLQGHARGLAASVAGGNAFSDMIDLHPQRSVLGQAQTCDESLFHGYYRAWAARMAKALA